MRYRYTEAAREDLRAYLKWIGLTYGRDAARRARARITREIAHFAGLPITGRRIETAEGVLLRWYVRPFIVYYSQDGATLLIERLYHAAREPIE